MARLNRTLEREVRHRAAGRCEYCLFPESASELPFISTTSSRRSTAARASLRIWHGHVFPATFARDRILPVLIRTGELTSLFNPRTDGWHDHFAWDGVLLRGKSAIGRATVAVLDINHVDSLTVRKALSEEES